MSNASENTATETLAPHYVEALKGGDVFECACGELYRSVESARACRKCRQYLYPDSFDARTVTDVRTGKIVWAAWAFRRETVCTCKGGVRNPRCPLTVADHEAVERKAREAANEAALLAAAKQPSATLTCNPFAGRF